MPNDEHQSNKSPRASKAEKPAKPYPDFPLFPHDTGRWAKKIRGKTCYFGPWDDPDAALKKYEAERDDLYAGRTPQPSGSGVTVKYLVNRFLTAKRHLVDTSELSRRTFGDYYMTGVRLSKAIGKMRAVSSLRPKDFERLRQGLAKTRGPVALGNEIQRIRVIFKYAYDAELIAEPVRFGPDFRRPSKAAMRRAKQARGQKMFEAAEILAILAAASQPLKAMVLLGINCGFGNADIGALPLTAIDLKAGWASFPRPKTAVDRRCPLWPETVKAIEEALAQRPKPKCDEAKPLVFVTKYGRPWAKVPKLPEELAKSARGKQPAVDNPVSKELTKLLKELKIHRMGLGFYGLRHSFETIGGDSKDQVAVNYIMGHADQSMAANYRGRIFDGRLRAVVQHVHEWLWPPA